MAAERLRIGPASPEAIPASCSRFPDSGYFGGSERLEQP